MEEEDPGLVKTDHQILNLTKEIDKGSSRCAIFYAYPSS